jgi:S1-C subfamily serine protease
VLRESRAETAGIKAGDIVVSIDQKKPGTLQRATLLLSLTNYGESWEIEVERGGKRKMFSIKAE